MDKIKALLEKQGYTKISNLIPTSSGDALQASAVNKGGSPVNLLINPKTGQVLKSLLLKK
jgi:Peptidase propeptide and YPEB domain